MKTCIQSIIISLLMVITAFPVMALERDTMRVVTTTYDITMDVTIAKEKGYFDLLGLDFDPVTVKGGTATIISAIGSGDVDGCFLASSGAFTAYSKGVKLVQVAGNGNRTFDFYVLKDSPIQSLKDFEGKKIANKPRPSGPWLSLRYDLDDQNINAEVIDVKTEDLALSALLSGQVDGAIGEATFMAMYGDKIRKVHTSTISKYLYNSCGWWVKESFAKEHPAAVKKFVDGILLARLFIHENQDEAMEILARETHMDLSEFKFKDSYDLPTFDMPTTIYKYGLEQMVAIFKQYNLFEGEVKVDDLVDPRFSIIIDTDY
ncbi:putative periplasmic sulfonate binding protein [Desulfamplus magnetovallimortis]|uniref:Putative periplasmic sulfonate binding protein n=1 Tax=Desulfamplus magnetovallimortis TaxID=1246637 RepID=A0A1W1HHD8_9BACT|nr:ABC transporter substrate-binding protein [Desulfamplus magnetovallimortis]SLM31889.1 putative periplasmic sulfonate binding protein [Desulfamplus magnetovallimortis]